MTKTAATNTPTQPEPIAERGLVPRTLNPADLANICTKSWRPAWSIRRRVGALAPILAWWRGRRN